MQATKELYEHKNLERQPTPTKTATVARLRTALRIENWHPDVVIKAFHDLDTIFFNGCLRGNDCVCWSDARTNWRHLHGSSLVKVNAQMASIGRRAAQRRATSGQKEVTTSIRGITWRTPYLPGQCRITLNAESLLPDGEHGTRSSWAYMWATLLREMCHAYDRVRTRSASDTESISGRGLWLYMIGGIRYLEYVVFFPGLVIYIRPLRFVRADRRRWRGSFWNIVTGGEWMSLWGTMHKATGENGVVEYILE